MAILTVRKGPFTETLIFTPPKALSELLLAAGFSVPHPCGGRGQCGKCAALISGAYSDFDPNAATGDFCKPEAVKAETAGESKPEFRLICQTLAAGDIEVTLKDSGTFTQIETASRHTPKKGIPMAGTVGAAIDIGTTTLALRRYDLRTGALIEESGMENPQTAVAADIMGRIGAAIEGKLSLLQQQVQDAIRQLLKKAGGPADALVITGNTTMLYLLTGRDPSCLSAYPFRADTLFDSTWVMDNVPVYLPPCMNAFVGADITCAVLSAGMFKDTDKAAGSATDSVAEDSITADKCANKTALLIDIGTNGELALLKNGKLSVTSTAAGPAFEGAGISSGVSSIPGAIDRVWVENGRLCLHTIGDLPAVGLCGSGLIDTVAALLDLSLLSETGALEGGEILLAPGVKLTQKDIRAVQLAKGAIAAGIETLLTASRTTYDEIAKLYIAGGFGSHLSIQSAVRIGLLPDALQNRVEILGNAALSGASMILLDREKQALARKIAAAAAHYDLGGDPLFSENYMDAMLFPEE